jgi:predicted site-specific integrase-resolvase
MNKNLYECIYNPQNPRHVKFGIRAVIYARVVNSSKESDLKLERQVKKCRNFIKSMGWKCLKVYTDKCSTKFKLGPNCENLFHDGNQNLYDFIVCTNQSRLSRNTGNLSWQLSVTNIIAPLLLVPIDQYRINPNKYLLKQILA